MNKIKYNSDSMKLIMFFESMTGAKVKDIITNKKFIFIIKENEMGKAIGKNGSNIKKIENKLRKKIKLVEFSNDIVQFVRNLVYPFNALDIGHADGVITIHARDTSTKAMLIGREHQNINHLNDVVKRYFDVKEIKID